MQEFFLNGESRPLVPQTLADLLVSTGLAERRVAVEINGEIVRKSMHATRQIQAGDRIEIVAAIGGG